MWFELNPNFSFIWFTNQNCDRFMSKHYSGSVNHAYQTLKPGAYKADLWRLCILYRYGGIYIDAYATPHVSIHNMLSNCYNTNGKTFISVLDCPSAGGGIHNGVIISEKRHPFLKQAINDIVDNVNTCFYGKTCLDITGPIALSKSIKKVVGYHRHIQGWNKHREMSYYLYRLEWGVYQNVYKGNVKILSKYFSLLYYLYRKWGRNDGYYVMWKNRDVYRK